MASLNINNHAKSSLEFVHRGTVVFLRYFGPFSNQRPFQNLHTWVCNRTSLCLQQRPQTEFRSPTKTTFSHVKKIRSGAPVISRSSGAKKWSLLHSQIWTLWTSFCVWSFLETKVCAAAHTSAQLLATNAIVYFILAICYGIIAILRSPFRT